MALDIQLLKVIQALDQHGTVTAAAQSLGITQPSVSHALARLRAHYGDALFVRSGSRLTKTPLAVQVCAQAQRLLLDFARVASMAESFDARTSRLRLRIHMIDVAELTILPRLLQVCSAQAPDVCIEVVRGPGPDILRELEEGRIDLAIGTPWSAEKALYRQRLLDETYVGIARHDHPGGKRLCEPAVFLRWPHCVVKPQGPIHARVEGALDRLSASRRVALQVPDFLSVPRLVAQSDLLAAVPGDLARLHAGEPGLRIFTLPVPSTRFSVMQHWHRRLHRDKAGQWLRAAVREAVTARATVQ